MPSFNWVLTGKNWLLAALPARTNGLLCAATWEMLERRRSQNSGYPLQGRVFVGTAEVEVDVAVALAVELPVRVVVPFPPTRRVTESVPSETVLVLLPVSVALAALPVDVAEKVMVEETEGYRSSGEPVGSPLSTEVRDVASCWPVRTMPF